MANKKISQLLEATSAAGTDLLAIVQGGVTKRLPASKLPISEAADQRFQALESGNLPVFDAKGDLLVATVANVGTRLGVGADGEVLTLDSSTATGLKWAAGGGGGGGFAAMHDTDANNNLGVGATFPALGAGALRNLAIGKNALDALTTGDDNVAAGDGALKANTTGSSNTAVGTGALAANTTGTYQTAIGEGALNANTTGLYNVAVGSHALFLNTTGGWNTALGHVALASNTTGGSNTALGEGALYGNTTGSNNVGVGHDALVRNTVGTDNMGIGKNALFENLTGNYNVAVGTNALQNSLTSNNVAIGYFAGQAAAAGNVTAIGFKALLTNTASNNTALGASAGEGVTTGEGILALGKSALYAPNNDSTFKTTTGGYQIGVGAETGQVTATQRNHAIAIGFKAQFNADYTIAIGNTAKALHQGSIALGCGFPGWGEAATETTATYQLKIGLRHIEYAELAADPAAGAANSARVYARDNGSGKTQLCVRFATGAVQVLATEP